MAPRTKRPVAVEAVAVQQKRRRQPRAEPRKKVASSSASSSSGSTSSDDSSDTGSSTHTSSSSDNSPIGSRASNMNFLILRSPLTHMAPWTHVALSVVAATSGVVKTQQRDATARKKLCADFTKALAAEAAYHEQRKEAEEAASARVGERAVALMRKFWHRVGKSYAQIAKTDAQEARRLEALRKQTAFIEKSEALTQELSMSLGARSQAALADQSSVEDMSSATAPIESKLTLLNTLDGARPLREYQSTALAWMVHRYEKGLNGILADEMGLGKTVQTIALLCYFAEHKCDWGPHLIVVPTPVVMNWGLEFRRWAPGLKVIEYVGSKAERAKLRKGWAADGAFNVCVTSFGTLMHDRLVFRSKAWGFFVVDEAHHLKNFNSAKYRGMFDLQAQHRLLLTGTPLQTSVMELWSLVHFVMPNADAFQSDELFREWFSNPLTDMAAGRSELDTLMVGRLHTLLRPFMLRRLKVDVAKDLPSKREVVVQCRLSRRQREMYQGYLSLTETKNTLSIGNYQGMVSILLALRKVCNHPDLFAERPVLSPLPLYSDMSLVIPGQCFLLRQATPSRQVEILATYDADTLEAAWLEQHAHATQRKSLKKKVAASTRVAPETAEVIQDEATAAWLAFAPSLAMYHQRRTAMEDELRRVREDRSLESSRANTDHWRCAGDILGQYLRTRRLLSAHGVRGDEGGKARYGSLHVESAASRFFCTTVERRVSAALDTLVRYVVYIPKACAVQPLRVISTRLLVNSKPFQAHHERLACVRSSDPTGFQLLHDELQHAHAHTLAPQVIFPDKRLLVHDCGKLQLLLPLLKRLRSGGHRCVIFTQFTGMIPILSKFMAMFALSYLTFDGSTKPDVRQNIVERFNRDPHIFALVLTTRAGGVGLNLVGADTVIFYDNDWNPAMDLQAQDRCHRIGQQRSVTIYRLVSERTVEEGILRKARERKKINNVVIRGGGFHEWSTPVVMTSGQLKRLFVDLDEADVDIDQHPDDAEDNAGDGSQFHAAAAVAEDEDDRRDLKENLGELERQRKDDDDDGRMAQDGDAQLRFEHGWTSTALARHLEAVRRTAIEAPVLAWAALGYKSTHPTTASLIEKAQREALQLKK